MRTILTGILLCLLLGMFSGVALAASADTAAPGFEAGRHIVRFASPPVARFAGERAKDGSWQLAPTSPELTGADRVRPEDDAVIRYRAVLAEERRRLFAAAAKAGSRMPEPVATLDIAVHAAVIDLTVDQAAWLAARPEVQAVVPDERFKLHTDVGPAFVGADQVWAGAQEGLGTFGEGAVVGVLDQGINWDHPAFLDPAPDGYDHVNPFGRQLGECINPLVRCNDKLVGVYDFTEEGTRGRDTDGHGTHVASTAVGNFHEARIDGVTVALSLNASGVAPHANLISYKVCIEDDPATPDVDEEGCLLDPILRAIDQAILDGVDVINYSIGGPADDPWASGSLVSAAMASARAAGVVPVVSAGNGGPDPSTISRPANSPWVIAVANTTHDRRFGNALEALVGGAEPPGDLLGLGITGEFGPARIVHARDFGNALCGVGNPELQAGCEQNRGISNPFAPGTFDGEIVVCDRGTYGRVEKGFNLRAAGAGGYVLANTASQGESINSDDHCLPAVHLGQRDGDRLRAWLEEGGNPNPSGRIAGLEPRVEAAFGDVVASSSARGPGEFVPGVMKPDLAAPGSGILAAGQFDDTAEVRSGTSMAAPHVAGAAALLKSARPDLTVDQIHSILQTTALDEGMRDSDGRSEADALDVGSGRLRVDRAMTAGLYLPVTAGEFRAANPSIGGDPALLNLPGMIGDCNSRCTFRRTVGDVAGGSAWRAELDAPEGVTATIQPAAFTLGAGEFVELTITIDVSTAPSLVGARADGAVRLVSTEPGTSSARLPFSLFVDPGRVPESFAAITENAYGSALLPVDGLIGLPEATFETLGLAPLQTLERLLTQDPSRQSPYDDLAQGVMFDVLAATAGSKLFAETVVGDNGDLDLFVGFDENGNGRPDEDEELCASTSPRAIERCVLAADRGGDYWVLVQNWAASGAGARDLVNMRYGAVAPGPGSLRATGPGRLPANAPFELRLIWDEGSLEPGTSALGFVIPKTVREPGAGELGLVPFILKRAAPSAAVPIGTFDLERLPAYALRPGELASVSLGVREGHGRLFFDVPAGLESVTVDVSSTENVDVAIQRSPFSFAPPSLPLARGPDVASAVRPGGVERLVVDRPEAGRYYVVLTNPGATGPLAADVLVTLGSGSPGPLPSPGLYANLDRSGHGINLNRTADQIVLQWYTYLEDGSPVWYLAQGPLPRAGRPWSAPLNYFRWDGSSAADTVVGDIMLTFLSEQEFVFSFRVNGESGSERFVALADLPPCQAPGQAVEDVTGLWFIPGQSGFGYALLGLPEAQVQLAYIYDDLGMPRWAYGEGPAATSNTFELLQFTGFCPTCEFARTTSTVIGLNDFDLDPAAGNISTSLAWTGPVPGSWEASGPARNLAPTPFCR